jgi:hypothetical protein
MRNATRVALPALILTVLFSLGLLGVSLYSNHVLRAPNTTLRLATPTFLAVADYSFPGNHATRSTTLSGTDRATARIIYDLGQLPYLGESVIGSCPNDDGSYFELVFTYSHSKTRVDIHKTGCADVFLDGKWSRRAPDPWSPLAHDLDEILRSAAQHPSRPLVPTRPSG